MFASPSPLLKPQNNQSSLSKIFNVFRRSNDSKVYAGVGMGEEDSDFDDEETARRDAGIDELEEDNEMPSHFDTPKLKPRGSYKDARTFDGRICIG